MKILIVDDDEVARLTLARILDPLGAEASFAVDGEEAYAQLAALLHESVELLLWYAAPGEARQLLAGAEDALAPMGDALMARWGLPEILRRLAYGRDAASGPRMVALAVRLARHLEAGWCDASLPLDFAAAGELLTLSPHAAAALVRDAAR